MKFAREPYSAELVAEMMPLWKEHYEELARFKDITLDPNYEVYEKCEAGGILRIFTARQKCCLMGYNIFVVDYHPHYKTSKSANQDLIYLSKVMRKGMTGYKFMKWCDAELSTKDRVQTIFQHPRLQRNFDPLLKRMGYKLMDMVYAKRIEEN